MWSNLPILLIEEKPVFMGKFTTHLMASLQTSSMHKILNSDIIFYSSLLNGKHLNKVKFISKNTIEKRLMDYTKKGKTRQIDEYRRWSLRTWDRSILICLWRVWNWPVVPYCSTILRLWKESDHFPEITSAFARRLLPSPNGALC